jgi:hypothetical protein
MERKEQNKHLEKIIRQLFESTLKLENNEEIIDEIFDLWCTNTDNNKEVRTLTKFIKKRKDEYEFTLISLICFLWKYEGTYQLCINILCRLLIANDHDLFDSLNKRFVDSINDIIKVDIETKQKFLERHNIELIHMKKFQRLRNQIAHHNYMINDTGKLSLNSCVVDIFSEVNIFLQYTADLFSIIGKEFPTCKDSSENHMEKNGDE